MKLVFGWEKMAKENAKWTNGFLRINHQYLLDKIRRNIQMNVFERYITDSKAKILDIGCGNGRVLKLLFDKRYESIYGIEPNGELVRDLKTNYPDIRDSVTIGQADNLTYPEQFFDCVYFFNVLHHLDGVDEYRKALDEASRCLKSGGYLIFVEPCRKFLYTVKRNLAFRLAPISSLFGKMSECMSEEKEQMELFIDSKGFFEKYFAQSKFQVLYSRRFFHQWTFVAKKT